MRWIMFTYKGAIQYINRHNFVFLSLTFDFGLSAFSLPTKEESKFFRDKRHA